MEAINSFSCSFIDDTNKDKVQYWFVDVTKESIRIINDYIPTNLTLYYDKYPKFSMIDATYHSGGVEVEGRFKSDMFEMIVFYKDYYEDEDDEEKITSQNGNILVITDSISFNFLVPYNLAKAFIKLGQGVTTELEGAIKLKNS